jgi:UDP-hydrolysing UDP-N-acetyl-D-glucosamine 2-epimerase
MKIGIVVTGRSDAGILEPLICALRTTSRVGNDVVVFNTQTGLFRDEIPFMQAQSVGSVAMLAAHDLFAANLNKLVVLGDRFETVAVALAAYSLHIPIVHLEGGETTKGSLDDGYRWCISEVATWHCAATKNAVLALKKAGMSNVYHTGALGCHDLEAIEPYTESYDFIFCYHPSNDQQDPLPYVRILSEYGTVLWIGPNNDAGSGKIRARMDDLPEGVTTVPSVGRSAFLGLVKASKCLVGNSSAGIIEAPSLGVYSINIGGRQKGRERANSVLQCGERDICLKTGIDEILSWKPKKKDFRNPYCRKDTLEKIIEVIQK